MSKYSRKAGEEIPPPAPVEFFIEEPLRPLGAYDQGKARVAGMALSAQRVAEKRAKTESLAKGRDAYLRKLIAADGASALYEMMQGNWDEMYAQYLKTNAWKVRRQEIIDRDICCRLCASEENLQVHHVDGAYKRIGNELDQDLTTLCRDCHEMYHSHKNSR